MCCPGKVIGDPDIKPLNLRKAIIEPEKVIAPTAAPIDISIRLASLISPEVPKLKTSKENMKHVFNLYHRDDDEHSPFWNRTYSDMDEWGQDALIEFNKTMNLINIWNAKNNDIRARGIIMGHSPQFMYGRGINSSINALA